VAELPDSEELIDTGALAAGYERLREAVLCGDAGGWRLGHGVLCARGMVGWMSAVGSLSLPASGGTATDRAEPPPAAEGGEPPSARPVSLPAADQVVAVLTQMVLPLAA
jgi:hypothetical protein